MKKSLYLNISLLLAISAFPSYAQQTDGQFQAPQQTASASISLPAITDNPVLDKNIRSIQHTWARIYYQTPDEEEQKQKIAILANSAAILSAQYSGYAEPKIWQAIVLSTQAKIQGGLGALGLVKQAKALLEEAEKINPNALDGSIYTSLGSLYYKVPGWPIGFGDKDKALAYLEQARAVNPNGIDPNYFYGDYLIEQKHYADAIPILQHALKAPPRPGRDDADAGRRNEIRQALAIAKEKAGQ